jgi:hypothetical protein
VGYQTDSLSALRAVIDHWDWGPLKAGSKHLSACTPHKPSYLVWSRNHFVWRKTLLAPRLTRPDARLQGLDPSLRVGWRVLWIILLLWFARDAIGESAKVLSQLSCNFPNGEQGAGEYCRLVSLGWSLSDSHGILIPSGCCHGWLASDSRTLDQSTRA